MTGWPIHVPAPCFSQGTTVTVDGNKAVAKFRQDYRADALSVSSRKTLDLRRVGERWLIVKETTGR